MSNSFLLITLHCEKERVGENLNFRLRLERVLFLQFTPNEARLRCAYKPDLSHNVPMSVAGGQVQRCIVSAVHDIDARPSHDEHVHHVGAALPAGPVEGAEAVVIAVKQQS